MELPKNTLSVLKKRYPMYSESELSSMLPILKELLTIEEALNNLRKSKNKTELTLIYNFQFPNTVFYLENSQLRLKFHHSLDLKIPIPSRLTKEKLKYLGKNENYQERLKVFNDRKILPEEYIKLYAESLRLELLLPDTKFKKGTFGKNLEKKRPEIQHVKGILSYNKRTEFTVFFDDNFKPTDFDGFFKNFKKVNNYRTGFKANAGQKLDIMTNDNLM
jgi:hypothetical protein